MTATGGGMFRGGKLYRLRRPAGIARRWRIARDRRQLIHKGRKP